MTPTCFYPQMYWTADSRRKVQEPHFQVASNRAAGPEKPEQLPDNGWKSTSAGD